MCEKDECKYSASAIIETYFCLQNVSDFRGEGGGAGGAACHRTALDFLFFTVHQFPTPVFSRSFHLLLDPVYRVSAALPASLSGTFLQTVPDLVTPLEGCRKPVLGVWVSPASHKKAPVSAGTWYWRLYFSLLLGKHLPVKTCMLLLGHTKQQQQQQ